jgi:hypothetical protein
MRRPEGPRLCLVLDREGGLTISITSTQGLLNKERESTDVNELDRINNQ